MESITITGRCKSLIRCRSLSSLKMKQVDEDIIELNEVTSDRLGDFMKPLKEEWTNVFIELHTVNPNIEFILPFFEKEKQDVQELVIYFENKKRELEIDQNIPKTVEKNIGGFKILVNDSTTLIDAKNMLFDYQNQLKFINECIEELTLKQK